MRFDEFMDAALYGPGGFFTDGGGAGRGGADFITSPEVGPLFGMVLARYLDHCWDELGQPGDFWVIEAAAGRGALAIAVLAAEPRCTDSLRYVLVERSEELRSRQRDHLPLTDAPVSDAPVSDAPVDEERLPDSGRTVHSVESMQSAAALMAAIAAPRHGVVIANELLDNIPFRLLQRRGEGWDEVFVAKNGDQLVERLEDAEPAAAASAEHVAPHAGPGARLPLQQRAAQWLADALSLLERGRVLVIDYGDDSASLAARPAQEWLRTYRGHDRGAHPLQYPGQQDITCEVAWDQLAAVAEPLSHSTQRDWLRDLGIGELVEEGRRHWDEHAARPDLAAYAARSRAVEADALLDPAGLGAFDVWQWRAGAATGPAPRQRTSDTIDPSADPLRRSPRPSADQH